MSSSCAAFGCVTMPWQPTLTPAAHLAHASSPSYPPSSRLSGHFTSHPVSDCRSHIHSHHNLDSVAGYGADGCQRNGVERRWDNWHKGWPERANCSKESAMVRLLDQLSAFRLLTFSCCCLLSVSINQPDKADAPLIPDASGYSISLEFNSLSHSPTTSRGIPATTIPFSQKHPRGPKTTRGFDLACACTGPARLGYCTNCTCDAEHSVPCFTSLSPFLTTNRSTPSLLTSWARLRRSLEPRCLRMSTSRDAFLGRTPTTPLAAALDMSQHASSALLPRLT